jgi:glycosyltransferase involved in cell wall biosynthesis
MLIVERLAFNVVLTFDDILTIENENKILEIKTLLNAFEPIQKVFFLRFVFDMPALIASADVMVFPFRNTEGPADYPQALLEAMACGTPVIATQVGGLKELIQHGINGLLVKPEDPAAIKMALKFLIKDAVIRKKMGQASVTFIRQRFEARSISRQLTAIYTGND